MPAALHPTDTPAGAGVRPLPAVARAARSAALLLAESAATLFVLFVYLRGWSRDFAAPLHFSRDSLEYLMQAKGTIENGWWWTHPRLSAPGTFHQVQYPSNPTIDQLIVWLFGRISSDPAVVVNASWFAMVALSGIVARRCFMLLGLPARVSAPAALLFALSPYALYRNVDHFSLATYLVPAGAAMALLAATARLSSLPRGPWTALIAGALLLGFNYPYYAFFTCALVTAGLLIAPAGGGRREAARGAVLVCCITAATVVNLAPSLSSWAQQGRPAVMLEKRAAEADHYGLKIRHLVSPVFDHSFPPFRAWTDLEENARFPLESENKSSRLGAVATLGFLMLMAAAFAPSAAAAAADPQSMAAAGRLMLAALLLATVGGLGSLFNLLVAADVRAYNRVTPFIAFWSLFAVAQVSARLLARPPGGRRWTSAALIGVLLAGLYDQAHAGAALNREHVRVQPEWTALGHVVQAIEARLPEGAMVFQLPAGIFLNDAGREAMGPYDQVKPYLASRHLRWAYPALDDDVVRWQQRVGRLPPPAMAAALRAEGFAAVLIDRNGYADRGRGLEAGLGGPAAPDAVLAESERYVALDLRPLVAGAAPPIAAARLHRAAAPSTRGVPRCDQSAASHLEWVGDTSMPHDGPISVPRTGEFAVSGWAFDGTAGLLAGDLDVAIGSHLYPTIYGLDRPDVAALMRNRAIQPSGFTARLPGAAVGEGVEMLSIRILSADRQCFYQGPQVAIVAR